MEETKGGHSLKPHNTFGVEINAYNIIKVQNAEELIKAYQNAASSGHPILILGEGSNVLFTEDFEGTVILNQIIGLKVQEDSNTWLLHIGAGEIWHNLVEYTLRHNMPGLENLALIPGCAGSAPIQNIGAYGVEFKQFCQYVDCIELSTGKSIRIDGKDCQFGYRDSMFKGQYNNRYAIIAIGLVLPKKWTPVLNYGDLTLLSPESVTPQQVFEAVCHMRQTKLPEPKQTGNAGSFFKNPIISAETAAEFSRNHPNAPRYLTEDGRVKLAAGWLIDQCGLKGHRVGGASVHRQQALVLINENNATSDDIVDLARLVRKTVGEKFSIWLEPEVRFIGRFGEVDAVKTIS